MHSFILVCDLDEVLIHTYNHDNEDFLIIRPEGFDIIKKLKETLKKDPQMNVFFVLWTRGNQVYVKDILNLIENKIINCFDLILTKKDSIFSEQKYKNFKALDYILNDTKTGKEWWQSINYNKHTLTSAIIDDMAYNNTHFKGYDLFFTPKPFERGPLLFVDVIRESFKNDMLIIMAEILENIEKKRNEKRKGSTQRRLKRKIHVHV